MSDSTSKVEERVKVLGDSIRSFREKLELHGRFSAHHEATEKELRQRWNEVQDELTKHGHAGAKVGEKLEWLERAIDRWVVSTDLDYKP